MRRLLASATLAAATLTTGMAAAQDGQDLVTIITSPEPQTQLMALVLTFQATQQGANAHIMLCGPAGDIALQDAPESATTGQPPRDMSPQRLMQMIQSQADATVEVCAIYLPGRGEDPSVLMDGVAVAAPDAMAARLMDADTRVLNF